MFEKIVSIVKEFLEKHFIPSLLSVVIAVSIFYLTPTNSKVLIKVGEKLFIFTVFCGSLVVIELIIKAYGSIMYKLSARKIEKEQVNREQQQIEDELFDFIHSLSPEDIKILNYFLENENKPLILNGAIYGDIILDNYCYSNEFIVGDDTIIPLNPLTLKPDKKLKKGCHARRYKLRDNLYDNIMILKKKYGKITKF